MINLEEFGELISKQEWAVKDGEIEYLTYLGKNKTYADNKFIFAKVERSGYTEFNCSIMVPEHESTSEIIEEGPEIKFTTSKITSFSHILSIADAIRSGNRESLPIVILGYHNATEKDEDAFQIKINENTIFCIDKDHELITEKKYFADEKSKNDIASDNFTAHYEFHDYGIYVSSETNESKSYLLNDEKSCFPESSNIELTDIIKNPLIPSQIPNLNDLPGLVKFFNNEKEVSHFEISYDEYGLPNNSYYCLYEAYKFDEYEYPVFAASLHPFYFDNFDSGILPGMDKFCIDQIDRSIDNENILIYSREIYEIKDKVILKELQNLIIEAREKNEPCIPVIE